MDIRPIYWVLCGAGATLLTSAWGGKQVMLLPQNQDANATSIAQASFSLPQGVVNNSLLMKRQPWTEAKSDPFSKVVPVAQNVAAPIEVEISQPQPPSFPYVFIGRLLAEEKDAVFLSRNNQIYSVAAGDTLEGVYRIERVGSNELEIVYLPDQQKLTLSFDALALNPGPKTGVMLSRADVPSGSVFPPPILPAGMAGDAPIESNRQMIGDPEQMSAPPPPEGNALNVMGFTPPPQGDVMQIMGVRPAQDGQTVPDTIAASAVPATPQQAGQ